MKQTLCRRLVKFGRRNMVSKWLAVSLLWLGSIFSRMPGLIAGTVHTAQNRLSVFWSRVAPVFRTGFAELSARLARFLPLLRAECAKLSSLRDRLSHFVRSELPAIPGRAWRSVRNGLREMRVRPLRRIAAIGLGLCTAFAMFPMEAFAANPAMDGYPDYPKVELSGSSSLNWYDKITYDDFLITSYNSDNYESPTISAFTGTVAIKSGISASSGSHTIPAKVQFKPNPVKSTSGLNPAPSGSENYYVYTVDTIKNGAFKFTGSQYFHITLPNTIKTIEADAFYGVGSVDVSDVTISALQSAGASAFGKTIVYVSGSAQAAAIPDSALAAKSDDTSGYRGRIVQKNTASPFEGETANSRIVAVNPTAATDKTLLNGFTLQYKSGNDWTNTLADGTPYIVYLNTTPVPLLGNGVETYVHIDNTTCAVKAETDVTAGAKVTVTVRNCGSEAVSGYNLSIAGTPVAGSTDSLFVGTPDPTTKHDVVVRSTINTNSKLYQLTFEGNDTLYIGGEPNLTAHIGTENSAKANDQIFATTGLYFVASKGTTIESGTGHTVPLAAGEEATLSITLNKTSGSGSDTGFSFDKDSLALEVGQSDTLTLTGDTSKMLSSRSLDESVATVKYENSSYTVTAKSVGTTTIQIINMSDQSKVVASCAVTVTDGSGSGGGGEPGGETGDTQAQLKAAEQAAKDALASLPVTKDTTAQDVLNAVTDAIKDGNVTVEWKNDSPQIVAPTESTQGLISGTIVITTGGQSVEVPVHITIDSTPQVDETKAITVTVVNKTDNTATSASNDTLQKAVEAALVSKGAGGYPGNDKDVKKLLIAAGKITTTDWNYLGGMENMTEFSINSKVTIEGKMPSSSTGSSIFPANLVSVSIPQEIAIGDRAFSAGYDHLKTVNIPNATSIGESAFDTCNLLTEASFPHVNQVGANAFRNCTKITNVNFPSLVIIKGYAFIGCTGLTSVSLPKSTTISDGAFSGCTALNSLSLPATPPHTIGTDAFKDCPDGRTLTIVDGSGTALTGEALTTAQAAYLTAEDGNTSDNLWYGWKVTDAATPPPAVTGTIVIKVNDGSETGGDTLSDAITKSAVTATAVTSLEIVSGEFTDADWKYLASLTAMTGFTIGEAVTDVAAMPDIAYIMDNTPSLFPKSIVTVSVPQATPIGNYAFYKCVSLTSASFPAATTIGKNSFYQCEELTSADFSQATTIGEYAFNGCVKLASVSLPKITEIPASAFRYCTSLTAVSFPLVQTVGEAAFNPDAALTSVSLPEATTIGRSAFSGCKALTDISLPKATTIGEGAFQSCTKLTSASLPEATTIGDMAFYQCATLPKISLPKATSIGGEAFRSCSELAEITLPAAPPTVGTGEVYAFAGCHSPRTLTIVDGSGTALTGEALATAQAAYLEAGKNDNNSGDGLWYGWKVTDAVTGTIVIKATNGDGSITAGGDTLAKAITASNITATEITSLEIVSGKFTTDDWEQLKSLSKMTSFTIDDGVTVDRMPDGISGTPVFPKSIVTASVPQTTPIGKYAFSWCKALTTVSIPAATSIGESAFENCEKLEAANFPEVTAVGKSAFDSCKALGSASIPNVITIGDYAFSQCKALTEINFEKATTIGADAFSYCEKLAAVNLPLITAVPSSAFDACAALTSVTLPKTGSIGTNAFEGCASLAEISLPKAASFGRDSFYGCSVLAEISLPANPPTRDNGNPFVNCAASRTLTIVDENGTALTDTPLATAVAAYKADAAGYNETTKKWLGWTLPASADPPAVTGTIVIKATNGDGSTTAGGDTLSDAITKSAVTATEITSLEVVSGKFTEADWGQLKSLSKMTGFTINSGVTVDNMPDDTTGTSIFPTSIVTVSVPQATPIGNYAFNSCSKLTSVDFPEATKAGTYAFASCKSLTSIELPKVTEIQNSAFYGCTIMTKAALPLAATIGKNAFSGCILLAEVELPLATSLGEYAFHSCQALATIELPKVETVGELAFGDCAELAEINLPSVTAIERSAFNGCTKLAKITLPATPPIIDNSNNPFYGCPADRTAFVPAASVNTYKTAADGKPSDGLWYGWKVSDGSVTPPTPDTHTVTGTVKDQDGNPVGNATVKLVPIHPTEGSTSQTQTDSDGKYTFTDVPEGSYEIQVTFPGGGTATGTITVGSDGTITGGTDITKPADPVPGGGLSSPLTQDKVNEVFGEGNATLNGNGSITINRDITLTKPVDVNTSVTIDLNGHNITGANGADNSDSPASDGQPAFRVTADNVTLTFTNSQSTGGVVKGGDGGNGGADHPDGGAGAPAVSQDTHTNCKIEVGTNAELRGGKGGDAYVSGSGNGGDGGDGSSTGSGDTAVKPGGSTTGGAGGNGSGDGSGGNGGNGSSTDSGNITVDNGGTSTGGNGGESSGSGSGGNGGNGSDTATGDTTVNGGATGGNGGDASNPSGSGNGGNGGNGSSANSGETVNGSGTVTGGNGGDAAGSGEGGEGGKGLPDGVNPGDGLDVVDGLKGSVKLIVSGNAGTTVTVPNESAAIDAVLTDTEKQEIENGTSTGVKVTLSVEKKNDQPDRNKVEEALGSLPASTVGVYFDISLEKVITKNNGSTTQTVTETGKAIEIRITIPLGMRGGSNYAVIRVHGGAGEALATRQEGNDLIFSSDKFSTFAIAYTPKTDTPIPGPSHNSGGSSNTYYHYTITAAAGEGGSISPSGEVYVRELDDQVFTVKTSDGYQVDKLLIDGKEATLKDGTYTFQEVLEDHTIRVSFSKIEAPETGAQTKPNQTRNPATGDNLNLVWLFVFLSALAGSNLFATALLRRNHRAKTAASVK